MMAMTFKIPKKQTDISFMFSNFTKYLILLHS